MDKTAPRGDANASQKGFTLIELSIVLVIIGLLVGGVIKGKDLIDNTKTTKLTQEYESYANALNAYRERYGSYPVDDDRFGETGTDDDNGWVNLRHAGLVALSVGETEPDDDHPIHTFGGEVRVLDGDRMAISTTANRTVCFFTVPAKAAAALDAKFDDGAADEGVIRAVTATTPVAVPANTKPGSAAYSAENYDVCTLAR